MALRPANFLGFLICVGGLVALLAADARAREKTQAEVALELARRGEQCLRYYQQVARSNQAVPSNAFPGTIFQGIQRRNQLPEIDWGDPKLRSNPLLLRPTREMVEALQSQLAALGIQSVPERRRKVYILRITSVPESFWLGRVLRRLGNRDWPGGRRALELEYDPLLDLAPSDIKAFYEEGRRSISVNVSDLIFALIEGRSNVFLHEVGHDRHAINLLSLLEPPPTGVRAPVPIFLAELVSRSSSGIPVSGYSARMALEELGTWHRDLAIGLAQLRHAETIANHAGQATADSFDALYRRGTPLARSNLRNEAVTLKQIAEVTEEMITARLKRPLSHVLDARSNSLGVPQAVVALNSDVSIHIPIPVELMGTNGIDAYVRDFLERTIIEARSQRAYAERALTTLGDSEI